MRPTVDLAGTEMRVLLPCADLAFATNLVDLRFDAVHVAIRQEPRSQPNVRPSRNWRNFCVSSGRSLNSRTLDYPMN
jgi:hypothetical protein